jgi:hypothetical protein
MPLIQLGRLKESQARESRGKNSVFRPLLQKCNERKDDEESQFHNCKGDKENLRGKYEE